MDVSTDGAQTDNLDARDERALTTPMTVIDNCGDVAGHDNLFEVTSASGSAYIVDTTNEACTCPDHKHRGVRCKHIRRVAFETGVEAIPASVDPDDVDDQLGEHISSGSPRVAVTDGGVATAEATGDGPEPTDPRADYIAIGVDSEGGHHVYRTTDETVFAIEDGRITQRYDVSSCSVNKWIDYVAHKRGWASQHLYKTAGGALGGGL